MGSLQPLSSPPVLPTWWWMLVASCIAGYALLHLGLRRRRARLYGAVPRRAPWFLWLGEHSADITALWATAGAIAPLRAFGNWKWTSMRATSAIMFDPPNASDAAIGAQTSDSWHEAVLGLAQQWGQTSLSGIVVCVDAASMQQSADAVRLMARRQRQRLDAVERQWGLRLPVFVIVTGLERLDGYATTRAKLPENVCAQAVGQRVHTDRRLSPAEVTAPIFERLRALSMALLQAHPAAAERLAIFSFFEAVRCTQQGLHTVLDELFDRQTEAVPPPALRGVYLTASDHPRAVFVNDLFGRILPAAPSLNATS